MMYKVAYTMKVVNFGSAFIIILNTRNI